MRTLALLICSVVAVACFKPLDAPLAEIPKLETIEEVMRANETIAGKQWGMEGETDYSAEDWTRAADAATRLSALAERSKNFSRGDVYNRYADDLGRGAKTLGDAAAAKDAAKASEGIAAMKASCKGCHAETR